MKDLLKAAFYAAPLAVIILYFSLQGKEEVKAEQRIKDAEHAIQSQRFDNDFADAFNNTPKAGAGAQIQKEKRDAQLSDLNKKADEARAKRDQLDEMFNTNTKQMEEVMSDSKSQSQTKNEQEKFSLEGKK